MRTGAMSAAATTSRVAVVPADHWWSRVAVGAVLPIALLVAWQIVGTAFGTVRTPLPSKIATNAVTLIASGDLPLAILQSLGRVFGGFILASLLAIPLGLAMGWSGGVERNV